MPDYTRVVCFALVDVVMVIATQDSPTIITTAHTFGVLIDLAGAVLVMIMLEWLFLD